MITLPHLLLAPEWHVGILGLILGVGELWLTILLLPLGVAFGLLSVVAGVFTRK